jgi:ParB-like nuclease domain
MAAANLHSKAGIALNDSPFETKLKLLDIRRIRTDGGTQCRATINEDLIAEYEQQMREGVIFPPITVWFDGNQYWLSDGFHRLAAARRVELTHIEADIRTGSLDAAIWHSFSANATHGLRRRKEDICIVLRRTLQHKRSAAFSNVEIAKHIGVSESTVRRFRNQEFPNTGPNKVRHVRRGGVEYKMTIPGIPGCPNADLDEMQTPGTRQQLYEDLVQMKSQSQGDVRAALNVFFHWAFGSASNTDCLSALGRLIIRQSRSGSGSQTGSA